MKNNKSFSIKSMMSHGVTKIAGERRRGCYDKNMDGSRSANIILSSITKFTTIISFRHGRKIPYLALAVRDVVAVVIGLVLVDTSPSSLERSEQKSRHEVHFLVKHYGRDGRKKRTREGVASRGWWGSSRSPGQVFQRRDDLRGRGEK